MWYNHKIDIIIRNQRVNRLLYNTLFLVCIVDLLLKSINNWNSEPRDVENSIVIIMSIIKRSCIEFFSSESWIMSLTSTTWWIVMSE